MKNKLLIGFIVFILIVAVFFALFYFTRNQPTKTLPTKDHFPSYALNEDLLTISDVGIVYLYDSDLKKKDSLDLNLINNKESNSINYKIEQVNTADNISTENDLILPTPTSLIKPLPTIFVKYEDTGELVNGLHKVKVTVQKGNNSWRIQKTLTPNQKILKMLEIVLEMNNGKPLNPIFPGDKMFFLKESTNHNTEMPETLPTSTPLLKIQQEEPVLSEDSENGFIYVKDLENNCFYVYMKKNKSFYKIFYENGLKAEFIFETSFLNSFNSFNVFDNNFYIISADNKALYKVNKNDSNVKKYDLNEKIIDKWLVSKDTLFYTTDEKIIKKDLITEEIQYIEIGDITKDLFFIDNYLYAYNNFGSGKNNSIILKINPQNLDIEYLEKIENVAYMFYSKDLKSIYFGILEKLTDLNSQALEIKSILPLNISNFNFESNLSLELNENTIIKNNLFYSLIDSNFTICNTEKNIIYQKVEGFDFLIIERKELIK